MGRFRSGVALSLVSVAATLLCGPAPHVSAQAPNQAPTTAPTKSVYGKLLSVDNTLNNVLMKEDRGAVSESVIPSGGLAEVMDECWCCAPVGESCTPGNKSGLGRALLVRCFK
jgi:hypothetical protein